MDGFGHQVSVNYRGEEKFQTMFGSCMTIFCFTLVVMFSIHQGNVLFSRQNTIFTKNTHSVLLHEHFGALHAVDNKFDFGVAVLRLTDYKYVDFDPYYVNLVARRMDMTMGEQITYKRNEVLFQQCDESQNFMHIPKVSWQTAQLKKFQCIDVSDLYFQGSFLSY
jgi:hypothetical protein